MKGSEIVKLIDTHFRQLRPFFAGILAADQVPQWNSEPWKFVIVNTGKLRTRGKHWILAVCTGEQMLDVVDSLGPDEKFLRKTFPEPVELTVNTFPLQPVNSTNCGFYCLLVAVVRLSSRDLPLKDVIKEIFTRDVNQNELYVREFFNQWTGQQYVT